MSITDNPPTLQRGQETEEVQDHRLANARARGGHRPPDSHSLPNVLLHSCSTEQSMAEVSQPNYQ